jgi:hypothetical protein
MQLQAYNGVVEPDAKRKAVLAYPERISHYEDAEGVKLLQELARRRGGVSLTALLRMLTREEAHRVGITAAEP